MNRTIPNEAMPPVSVDALATLLRMDDDALSEVIASIPDPRRAALAAFCFGRSHLRSLSFRIAAACDIVSLRRIGGPTGEALAEHSRNPADFDAEPKPFGRKSITLARSSA